MSSSKDIVDNRSKSAEAARKFQEAVEILKDIDPLFLRRLISGTVGSLNKYVNPNQTNQGQTDGQAGGAGGTNSKTCYRCRKPGHLANDCTGKPFVGYRSPDRGEREREKPLNSTKNEKSKKRKNRKEKKRFDKKKYAKFIKKLAEEMETSSSSSQSSSSSSSSESEEEKVTAKIARVRGTENTSKMKD